MQVSQRAGLLTKLDKLSSNPKVSLLVYSATFIIFISLVIAPSVIGLAIYWDSIHEVFQRPELMERSLRAIFNSYWIGLSVTLFDLLTGLPLAWFIARSKHPSIEALDTLVDLPLVMPTVALGYSTLLFWGRKEGIFGFFGEEGLGTGATLVFLLHLTFSYPYIVRTIVGVIRDTDLSCEIAARTLGASSFATARTVGLPLLKKGIIAAGALAFARSLSETGATMVVAGMFETGPVFIKNAKEEGLMGPLIFVSLILILSSVIMLIIVSYLADRLKVPIKRGNPVIEGMLSSKLLINLRNLAFALTFLFFIFVPAFFFLSFGTNWSGIFEDETLWSGYWQSFATSFIVAGLVTVVDIILGIPMAIAIGKKKFGRFTGLVDGLVNVSILIPTVALGTSLRLFWTGLGFSAFLPEILLIILAHMSFTYPFIVKVLSASISSINPEVEHVARVLGASPFKVFRTITFPLTKWALFAGAVMVFARSVDETGATIAVAKEVVTVPILLVNWIKSAEVGVLPLQVPAVGCMLLTMVSFVVILGSRLVIRIRAKRATFV
mgnify:CR=1 FL=1